MGFPVPDERCTNTRLPSSYTVVLTRGFEIMNTEVTQHAFENVMGYNPSYFNSTDPEDRRYCGEADCREHPVEQTSWHAAAYFCNQLSEKEGLEHCYTCHVRYSEFCLPPCAPYITCHESPGHISSGIYECPGYRLPTQAEFEYAYRAGSETPFYPAGDSDGNWATDKEDGDCGSSCQIDDPNVGLIAWYCANSGGHTHRVGTKLPNAWRLYDLAGNVGEKCHDWWEIIENSPQGQLLVDYAGPAEGRARRGKGGGATSTADEVRAGAVGGFAPQYGGRFVGFRCARSLLGIE